MFLIMSFKLRLYLSHKLKSNKREIIEKQLVLFFPEKKIKLIDLIRVNINELIKMKPTSELSQLLSVLKSCRTSLDVCMYCIAFEPIIQLIKELGQRGIEVRLIINGRHKSQPHFNEKSYELRKISGRLTMLSKFGVKTKTIKNSLSYAKDFYMHHKFAVIDNNLLINGSLNWTENGIFGSYNDCLITTDPKLVSLYLKAFNEFWDNY